MQYTATMPNPQLDQFTHALFWKAVPWIILGGGGAMLLREFLRWLERRAIRFEQDRRKKRAAQSVAPSAETKSSQSEAPRCPICNAIMVQRNAKRGAHAGSSFWGCPNYPQCRGTRES